MLLQLLNLFLELLNLLFVAGHRVTENFEDVLARFFLGLRGKKRLAEILNVLFQDCIFCLQALRLLGSRRLRCRFKPLRLNLGLSGLLDLLRFKLLDVLFELRILVV